MNRLPVAAFLLFGLVLFTKPGAAQTWDNLTPSGGDAPSPRAYATAVYDAATHRMIVFGGRGASGDLNDVWAFDLNTDTWSDLTPTTGDAPAPRRTAGGVYDPEQQRFVIWSGQGDGLFNDVWAFDLTGNTWTELTPADPKPNVRYGVASVFDPIARRLVTFAGFTEEGRFEDTWALDLDEAAWTELTPETGNPGLRCLHSASYDPHRHRMIIYGGQRSGALEDLWALDLNTHKWTDLTPQERPEGRFFAAHVYDTQNRRALIFGGRRDAGPTNEVWGFDLQSNTWKAVIPAGTPPEAREGSTGIYVEEENRMIIFGGLATEHSNEVWSLNNSTSTAAEEPDVHPSSTRLDENYPNPVRSTTAIHFTLPAATHATLRIYNLLGQEVATLASGHLPATRHTRTWDASPFPAGVYLSQLQTDTFIETRRLLVVKE